MLSAEKWYETNGEVQWSTEIETKLVPMAEAREEKAFLPVKQSHRHIVSQEHVWLYKDQRGMNRSQLHKVHCTEYVHESFKTKKSSFNLIEEQL